MVDSIITMSLPFPVVPAMLGWNNILGSQSCTLYEAATANITLPCAHIKEALQLRKVKVKIKKLSELENSQNLKSMKREEGQS